MQEKKQGFELRSGMLGYWDKFVGPGWTDREQALLWGVALVSSAFIVLLGVRKGFDWGFIQCLVAFLLALDVIGGAIALAANPGKRWYHRAGRDTKEHMSFIAWHVHPFIIAWLFNPTMDWGYAILGYGYLLAASYWVLSVTEYFKRPLAVGLICFGCVLSALAMNTPPGFGWFLPVFYLKLLSSHLLPEAVVSETVVVVTDKE